MASVRMNQNLRNQMRRAAEDAWGLANPEPKSSPELANEITTLISNSKPQQFLKKIKEELENKWLGFGIRRWEIRSVEVTHINFCWDFNDDKSVRPSDPMHDRHRVPMVGIQLQIPFKQLQTMPYSETLYASDIVSPYQEPDKFERLKNLFFDLHDRHKKNQSDYLAYQANIHSLLNKCNTLKQVLEIWPAAENLVPAAIIQRLHEKITRKNVAKKVREEIQFDDTAANKTLLTAKLLGGT